MSNSWQLQLKQALRNQHTKGLDSNPRYANQAAEQFAPVITEAVLQMIDANNPDDPVLAQFLPTAAETVNTQGLKSDPVGDGQATQVPGLIHKYQGRVLLIASGTCAVNCRYCFRRHFPYSQSFAPRNHWQASINYLTQHTDIHEVILSGGDPLTLETSALAALTQQLKSIPHIKTLRIHSRIPVVMPDRIDDSFGQWAQTLKLQKVLVIHVNHPAELTAAAKAAIGRLQNLGFMLLNQSVMLKNINDKASILQQLSEELFSIGVLPYYLHQMDQVQNAAHFMVPEQQAKAVHRQLKALLPGYLVPRLVKEIAGQAHKTTISE